MAPTYRKRYKKRRTRKRTAADAHFNDSHCRNFAGIHSGNHTHKVKQERAQQTVSDSSWDITDKKYADQRPELDVELLPVNEYSVRGLHLKRFVELSFITRPIRGTTAIQNRNYFAWGWNNLH